MTIIQRAYTLSFHSPAFLGNAQQIGQWRTPPFKAQLRQWWRVAYAAGKNFQHDVTAMRQAEGRLFGNAWLEGNFSKSLVRIRLADWRIGKLNTWEAPDPSVTHKEVPKPVGAQLYLGFGPLLSKGKTALKANAAIQAGEHATFSLAYPDEQATLIEQALALMDRFGTVGGRSRNGWGSYALQVQGSGWAMTQGAPLRDWRQCLQLDWPHALGQDGIGPLIWETKPQKGWQGVMKDLAMLKIGLRTKFAFTTGSNAVMTEARHWLSYPVTNHSVQAWGNNARLPNSLRFKLRPSTDNHLVGVIFHMPCQPPAAFAPNHAAIEHVWLQVHAFLDRQANLTRAKV